MAPDAGIYSIVRMLTLREIYFSGHINQDVGRRKKGYLRILEKREQERESPYMI